MAEATLDIKVRGAESLRNAARALRRAGRVDLVRAMEKNIKQEMRPTIAAVRRNARGRLPQRGGLNERVARSKMNTRVRTTGQRAGVRLVAANKYHIQQIDKGWVRHPLFGDRSQWYVQKVTPGWFTRPLEQRQNHMRKAVFDAIEQTLDRLERHA